MAQSDLTLTGEALEAGNLDAATTHVADPGRRRRRSYVVAMLDPAEMRFSSGATLTFATATFEGGRLTLGKTYDTASTPRAFRRVL